MDEQPDGRESALNSAAGKCLFLIQDGLGDRPNPELDGRTPLEAASTPHMDSLVEAGISGLMDMLEPGVRVGTDIGHLVLFEQDPNKGFYGRGPMEAAGLGVLLQPGEVALRFNFATVNSDQRILDRRAGRIREGTEELSSSLSRMDLGTDVQIEFLATTEHRGALILRGRDLSQEVTDSDPGGRCENPRVLQVRPRSQDHRAHHTAEVLNRILKKSFQVLEDHPVNINRKNQGKPPANGVLTRGAGEYRPYDNLPKKRGLRMACISGECTVLGLARLAGVTPISTESMTANLDTDLKEKAKIAVETLRDFDLVYLHIKGADIAGHDRQPVIKKEFIEKTDLMVGQILRETNNLQELYYAFGADHSTPCLLGEHSGDPVPVFLTGPDVRRDSVKQYGERTCARGGLGRIRCKDFLATIFDYLR